MTGPAEVRHPPFVPKFKPKQPLQHDKLTDWIIVKTRLSVALHRRVVAVAKREGATMEYVARKMIESCLPGWEQTFVESDKTDGVAR